MDKLEKSLLALRSDDFLAARRKLAFKASGITPYRREVEDINSFKFITDAIEYETERQITELEEGRSIKQETRLWNTKEHISIPMRTKEELADYRYFHEPDLPLKMPKYCTMERNVLR